MRMLRGPAACLVLSLLLWSCAAAPSATPAPAEPARSADPLATGSGRSPAGPTPVATTAAASARPATLPPFLPPSAQSGARVSPLECGPRGDNQNYRIEDGLAISPRDGRLLYLAVEWLGVFRSEDRGATWLRASDGIAAYPRLDDPTKPCFQEFGKLVIDPSDDQHVLVSRVEAGGTLADPITETAGVWESRDGGRSWRQLLLPGMNAGGGWSLAISRADPRVIYYGAPNLAASRPGSDPNRRFSTRGVLYRTSDGGQTWDELPTGLLPDLRAGRVYVDGERVFLATFALLHGQSGAEQLGPLRSQDGGRTWTSLASRLPAPYRAVADAWVAPTNSRNIYLSPVNSDGNRQYGFASRDGGDTFTQTAGPFVAQFDPHDPAGLRLLGVSYDRAVQRSDDGGLTWRQVGQAPGEFSIHRNRITTVVYDPTAPGVVYLGASGPYVWRSTDGGASWTTVLTRERLPTP